MKKNTLFLTALLISTMSFAAESLQVTMDFSTNDWGFPTSSTKTAATYANGTYTIEVSEVCNGGHKFDTSNNCFIVGKSKIPTGGTDTMYATVTLPPFEFKTTKIIIYGHANGSGNVTRNIYVGDQAVSTATTSGKVDHTYEIAADYQAAGTIYRIQVGNNYNSHITKIEFYGEAEADYDATKYNVTATVNDEAMGSVSGTGEFAEGSTVVLTAEPKLGYEFVKWEDESTVNPRQVTVNADVNVVATFQALPAKTIAEVNALADNSTFALNEFVVTYVNGNNTYIKDATGYAVICSDQAYGLNAGDVVAANKFIGTKVTKSSAIQYQPAVEASALGATAGTAPTPEVLATMPANADIYKYVKYEQVTVQGGSGQTYLSTLGSLSIEWLSPLTTFTTNGIYEMVGIVTKGSMGLQMSIISEKKLSLTIAASVNDKNMGKVKGAGEYLPGTEATLTAEPKEGYEFANWTAGEEVVSTEEVYTFTVSADAAFVANFKEEVKQQTITLSYELTPENVIDRMGRHTISAEDEAYDNPQLVILGFDESVSSYTGATLTIDTLTLTAEVTYTKDAENNTETYVATATTEDGLTIFNVTFIVVAPAIQEHILMVTYPTVTLTETPMGGVMYVIEGEAMMDTEDNIVNIWMNVAPDMYYAEMGIGEDIYATGEALVSEPFMGEFTIEAVLTDDAGNKYNVSVLAYEIKQNVEIVVKETVALNGYNMQFEMQGNMAIVTANVKGIELFFWMTMYTDDNGYGTYFNDAITNVWYGEISLTPYGDEHVYSAENLKVSFINDPDDEGNVTLYEFTLYTGANPSTGVENLNGTVAPVKMIENGQIFIIRNGVKYNAQGAKL